MTTIQPPKKIIFSATKERYYLRSPLLRNVDVMNEELGIVESVPGYGSSVALSKAEEKACECKAYEDTLKDFKGKAPLADSADAKLWKKFYEDHFQSWIVYLSMRNPDKLDEKLFENKEWIYKEYTTDELSILHSNYNITVLNQPAIKHITDDMSPSELVDKIISQATEEETAFFLNSHTMQSQARSLRFLAGEVVRLRQENGLSGMPFNDIS